MAFEEELEKLLEDEEVIGDLSRAIGKLELEQGFTGDTVKKEEALDRPSLKGSMPKLIGTGFEQLAAHNYGGEFRDNCADVYIGLNENLQGFPVQVKSCLLFRKDNKGGQRANFVIRHNSYSQLPEDALIELNLYNPVDQPEISDRITFGFDPGEYLGRDDFEAVELEGQVFEKVDEGREEDEMTYLDLHRRVLITKELFEEVVWRYDNADLSLSPDTEEAPWYKRGEYNVPWKKIFGIQGTPVENSPLRKTARELYQN